MVRLHRNPNIHSPEARKAIFDAIDEATWERARESAAETQRIMRPLAAEFFQQWYEEDEEYLSSMPTETEPARHVIDFMGRLRHITLETLETTASWVFGETPWIARPATLGGGSAREQIAERRLECPNLAGIPGIEPAINVYQTRHGNKASVRFDLRGQYSGETPDEVCVAINLIRNKPQNPAFETLQCELTVDKPSQLMHLSEVTNREVWDMTIVRVDPVEEGEEGES